LVVPIGTDEDDDHGAGAPTPQKPHPKEVLKTARNNPTKVEPTNKHAHLNSILKSLRLSAQTTAMTAKDMTADDAELVRETCELALQVNVTKVGSLRVDQLAAVAAALKSRRNQKAVDPEEDVPF
jgi:transcription elongation factor Elf1